jgi:DNA invertase Pin-like site-specific DNA recombinase
VKLPVQIERNGARLIAVYQRVSTERQDVSRQHTQVERAVADYPDREVRVIVDDGVSAFRWTIFERPGGRELCDLIEAGRVEAVYADAQDRLSRGRQSEWWNFVDLCEQAGTRIVIDGRELRLGEEGDEIRSAIDAILARRESKERSHRLRGGMRRVVEDGRYLGSRRPYGFDLEGERKQRRLVLNPVEAGVIEWMAGLYEHGAGDVEVAARLNERGIPSPTGVRWEKSQVRNVLCSPLIAGYVHRNGERYEGRHEAILDRDRWNRLQEVRAARRGKGRRPEGGHVFTGGILRCPECRSGLRARTTPKGHAYYECPGRNRRDLGIDCDQSSIDARLIERLILGGLLELVFDADETEARIRAVAASERDRAASMIGAAEKQLASIDRKRKRAHRDYLDEKLTADLWAEASKELDEQRLLAEAHIAEVREAADAMSASAEDIDAQAEVVRRLETLQSLVAGAPEKPEHVQSVREALHATFERVYLDGTDDGGIVVIPVPRHDSVVAPGPVVTLELRRGRVVRQRSLEVRRQVIPSLDNGETTSPLAQGTNGLIRIGAIPLTSVPDALDLLGLAPASSTRAQELPAPLRTLLDGVRTEPGDVDRVARRVGRSAAEVATGLVELELAGLVVNVEGVYRVTA